MTLDTLLIPLPALLIGLWALGPRKVKIAVAINIKRK